MILWFTLAQIAVGVIGATASIWAYTRRSQPNDITLGAALLLGVLLLAQIVVATVAPATGNAPLGDPLEFWMYLITATVLPFGVGVWALIDRRRSANLVIAVMQISVAVMLYRMLVIWLGAPGIAA